MEDNFRNVLIILSAIVITAIFIHGLWTIRKQKNPYKLKAAKKKTEPITRDFDRTGFDQDGVGQVKVKKSEVSSSNDNADIGDKNFAEDTSEQKERSETKVLQQSDTTEPFLDLHDLTIEDAENPGISDLDSTLENDWFKEDNSPQFTKEELGDELTSSSEKVTQVKDVVKPKVIVPIKPLYEQPVTQAKPRCETKHQVKPVVQKPSSKAELKRNQIEIDFDNEASKNQAKEVSTANELEPQVLILSVVMPANQQMFGAALLPSLLTLGLKYGEMNIFHRHEDNAGKGKVTFSLANIMNPGSFDLDNMESFATRGVSLFMMLPNASDPFNVFEQMLNAAKQLAQEFNAQVIDDKRNVMTKQTEQHYISKIREFDRQSRIALGNPIIK